jgi:hypothetical protein
MEARTGTLPDREAKRLDHPWLGAFLEALDDRLRARNGVIEYSRSPDCLFRIGLIASSDDIVLADGTHVHAGDRLIDLHVWNEHVPPFPRHGPNLGWALRVSRALDGSLRELHRYIESHAEVRDVVALRANMTFRGSARSAPLGHLAARYGFEPVAAPPSRSPWRRLHRFGENILISLVVLARNAAALHADTLWRDRTMVLLTRQALQRRYGGDAGRGIP